MIIALDRAIPYWREAFADLGEIRPFSGRDLKPEDIRNADALIVRTVTPVNASLLEGSSIRFVAAASAGIDHIDQEYLRTSGIYFGYAAGSNANAVSEYIVTALHVIASRKKRELKRTSIAVIGVGHVGSRVAKKADALGMKVLLCDPPLRDLTGDSQFQPFEDILGADILSFHVPLAMDGLYPTRHLLDRKILNRLSPKQFVINSSRGPVVDNQELKSALLEGRIEGAVLDVWEEEPQVDYSLLELADLGTPHIAGTSLDGKIKATEMIREELHRFLGQSSQGNMDHLYSDPKRIHPEPGLSGQDAMLSTLLQAYDIRKDDADLRRLGSLPAEHRAQSFEQLRSSHLLRPEFPHFIIDLDEQQKNLIEQLAGLGFKLNV
jgi:erythronate-4-phosphate dehydrogenase